MRSGYDETLVSTLFFDFDGLILDTETPEVLAWQELFESHGHQYPDEVWRNIVGRGPDQVAEQPEVLLKRLASLDESPESIRLRFRERYWNHFDLVPCPGAIELLDSAKAKGHRMCIVSSSLHSWVDDFIAQLEIGHFFEMTICRDDAARSKPAPDLYIKALELMSVLPSEVIAFEDSQNGVRAAYDAGIPVIACPNHVTRHLDFSLATQLVTTLHEVVL
jgi:HAD superfamily hydrolase (TIGR01509 family)